MSTAAGNLNNFLQTLRIATGRRILAEARSMQINGDWITNGDDVFDCWRRSFSTGDQRLPTSHQFTASFLDTAGSAAISGGTVVMCHGSPGSHNDFKYIIPELIEKKIRVLAPNFPGHGFTEMPQGSFYRHSNEERAEFLVDCAKGAGLNKVDVMLGHSAGCYPLLKIAADNHELTRSSSNGEAFCRVLVLVNPGGILKPHRALNPYWLSRLGSRLYYTRFLQSFVKWVAILFWRYVLRFRNVSPDTAVAGMNMVANIGFSRMAGLVDRLASDPSTPRVLIIYAEDDQFVEVERCEELALALGVPRERTAVVTSGGSDQQRETEAASEFIRQWWTTAADKKKEGDDNNEGGGGGGQQQRSRHAAVLFKKGLGGHYLQKHQAAFIVSCLEAIIDKKKL